MKNKRGCSEDDTKHEEDSVDGKHFILLRTENAQS